ncbi:MAG: hypothetical protein RL328_1982, partial [Acidobacteriota bacterium]
HAAWFTAASTLDVRVARLLPCDKAATAAIEEVSQASTARLIALNAYLNSAAEQASRDLAAARLVQRAETAYLAGIGTERTDTEQERAGIESQINNLAESVRKKVSLTAASDDLKQVEAAVRERANLITTNASAAESTLKYFEDFVSTLEKREAALRKQASSIDEERIKWNGYYTARLARARVECTAMGAGR